MRQRIADELNRLPSEIIGSPSLTVEMVINREINSALKHYESIRTSWSDVKEEFLASTVNGTRNYSLSSGVLKIDSLKVKYNNSYIILTGTTWDEMEEQDRQITGSLGIPQDYVRYGNSLRLYPVPNQSMSILMSYTKRAALTSLTGSYTSSASVTPTSTASHNNRTDGWMAHGEELIRLRAKAAVQINYLRDAAALAEAARSRQRNERFVSLSEEQAYAQLADEMQDQLGVGRTMPYYV